MLGYATKLLITTGGREAENTERHVVTFEFFILTILTVLDTSINLCNIYTVIITRQIIRIQILVITNMQIH